MKKVLSLTLALMMLLMSVSAAFTTQAKTPLPVNAKVAAAAKYVKDNSTLITKNEGVVTDVNYNDYWLLLDAGADLSDLKDDYLAGLKANLDKNNGKIVIEGTTWYQDEYDQWQSYSYSYEDIAVYGSVIATLNEYGINVSDFEGYNIKTPFLNFDLSTISNPYSYRIAVYSAHEILFDNEFTYALVDDMINRFYTMGQGMNYYGYSCDNTCHFLATLFPIATDKDYSAYIDDACGVVKSYTLEDGAYADSVYVTTVNADSTALAMLGFASVQDIENAYWYYQKLLDGFYNSETGAFQTDGADNLYATKDALLALTRFAKAASMLHVYSEENASTVRPAGFNSNGSLLQICPICTEAQFVPIYAIDGAELSTINYTYNGKAKTPAVIAKDIKGNTIDRKYYTVKYASNKNVGVGTATITFKDRYTGTLKLAFVINPKGTSVTKLTAAKKGFTAKWNKQATQTTGYQLQYSTNKSFKNAKTVTVKSNKTVSKKFTKLASKKKYFVRVRTYKTVNGKKYYSKWSAAKAVTTK